MKACKLPYLAIFLSNIDRSISLPATANKTSPKVTTRRSRALLVLACAIACVAALPAAANAQSFVVDTDSDSVAFDCDTTTMVDADCSLRGAITKANQDSAADTITFSGTWAISINTPLPAVENKLSANAQGVNVGVFGGGGYICTGSDYAIDITDPAAQPTTIQGLPFNDVCGRAIRSNVAPPTIAVGPRRADNTVSINGIAGSATSVDIFEANTVAFDGEADTNGFMAAVSAAGTYSLPQPIVPTVGDMFTATATGAAGTSNFSTRAATPADLTSPTLNNVVATSSTRVRLDFNEALSPTSGAGTAFSLGMANAARPIIASSVSGNSIFLETNVPWAAGEAGAISMTGNGRVADAAGNELLGTPTAPVYAGPGEVDLPVISNFKLAPNRFCQRKSSKCKRGTTFINITLNKPSRVIFKVARGTARRSELVTFVHRLKAGRNKVKFDAVVSGRTLPATILTIRAIAQDAARSLSAPVDTPMKIVKSNRDL